MSHVLNQSAFVRVGDFSGHWSLLKYRHLSLSTGLLFGALTVRGLWIVYTSYYLQIFPSVIRVFCIFKWQKGHNNAKTVKHYFSLLFEVLVLAGICWDVNNEGHLYNKCRFLWSLWFHLPNDNNSPSTVFDVIFAIYIR